MLSLTFFFFSIPNSMTERKLPAYVWCWPPCSLRASATGTDLKIPYPLLKTSSTSGSMLAKRSLGVFFGRQPMARDLFPLHLEFEPNNVNPWRTNQPPYSPGIMVQAYSQAFTISSGMNLVGSSVIVLPSLTKARPMPFPTSYKVSSPFSPK